MSRLYKKRAPERYEVGVSEEVVEHCRYKEDAFASAKSLMTRRRVSSYVFDIMAHGGTVDYWSFELDGTIIPGPPRYVDHA